MNKILNIKQYLWDKDISEGKALEDIEVFARILNYADLEEIKYLINRVGIKRIKEFVLKYPYKEVEKELIKKGKLAYRLDGDNICHGLDSDLGFLDEDREENIRGVAEVAALFKDAGIITLVSFISPFRRSRNFAREKVGSEHFIEVSVKASLETCIQRDPKGPYKKALKGEINDFTGIDSN